MTGTGAADPEDIRGWQRLSPELTTSGRLCASDPARLAALGVKRVINLALDDHPEALAGEADLLAAEGVAYIHIPIPFAAPEEAHYRALVAVLEEAEGPVHVHCIMNWRVSALLYRRHREQGMDEAAARALMLRQWDPFSDPNPAAPAWAALISS